MLATSRLGITYPKETSPRSDAPDIPLHIKNLAVILDTAAIDGQGSIGSRPTSTPVSPGVPGRYYYVSSGAETGQMFRDYGTGWEDIGRPRFVTALPGAPYDKQEIFFQADASLPAIWHLRYNSSMVGSYKWQFLGGAPLWTSNPNAGNVLTSAYADLSGGFGDPQFTLPLAGVYDIRIGCYGNASNGDVGFASYSIGATAASDDRGLTFGNVNLVAGSYVRHTRVIINSAAQVIKMQHRMGLGPGAGGGVAIVKDRWLEASPVVV